MASHTDLLPPELRAGWVYNRVLRSVGDTVNDEDQFPDGVPAEGEVVFEPDVSTVQVNTDGVGTTVVKDRVTCKIHQGVNQPGDPDRTKAGLLIDPAGSVGGVYLSEGGWTATYQLLGASVPPVQFVLTEEHTKDNPLDIALVAGLTPSPTVKFVVNEQVYYDTLAARDETLGILSSVQSDQDEIRDLLEYAQLNLIDKVYVGSGTPPENAVLWIDTTDGGKRVKSLVDGVWVDVVADVMRPFDADTLGGLSPTAFRKTADAVDADTFGAQGSSDFMRYLPGNPVGTPINGFDANTVDRGEPSLIPMYNGVNTPSENTAVLETIPYSPDWVAQYFHEIDADGGELYRREFHSGTTWGEWEQQGASVGGDVGGSIDADTLGGVPPSGYASQELADRLGASTSHLASGTDLNTVTQPGVYSLNGSWNYQNPAPIDWGLLHVTALNTGSWVRQVMVNTNATYERFYSNARWGAWSKDSPADALPDFADLNDVRTTGVYTLTGSPWYANEPVPGESGFLEVTANPSGTAARQVVSLINRTRHERWLSANGKWGNWAQVQKTI